MKILQSGQDISITLNPSAPRRFFSSVERKLEDILNASSRAMMYTLTIASAFLPLRCGETTLYHVSNDTNVYLDTAETPIDVLSAEATKNEDVVGLDSIFSKDTNVYIDTAETPVDILSAEATKNEDIIGNDNSNSPQPDYIYTVTLQSPHSTIFPLAGKNIDLLYYPIPNPDFADGLEQLDAKLTIIPIKNKVYPEQDLEYAQELFKSDIPPYAPNKFVFNVPTEGAYFYLLNYVLHYENGTSIEYPDYTSAIGKFKEGGNLLARGS